VQLDDTISSIELTRLLEKQLRVIEYRQTRNIKARVSHWKRRLQQLKDFNIDLSKLPKCFKPFVAL